MFLSRNIAPTVCHVTLRDNSLTYRNGFLWITCELEDAEEVVERAVPGGPLVALLARLNRPITEIQNRVICTIHKLYVNTLFRWL